MQPATMKLGGGVVVVVAELFGSRGVVVGLESGGVVRCAGVGGEGFFTGARVGDGGVVTVTASPAWRSPLPRGPALLPARGRG